MSFGDNLKYFRKQKSFSQDCLANKLNVTRQAVSRWENGKSLPDIQTLSKISEIFDVSIDCLISGKNESDIDIEIKKSNFNKEIFLSQYSKYLYVVIVIFTLACTLPKDISVPIMFFGKLIIIFFVLLLVIYFIIRKYLI